MKTRLFKKSIKTENNSTMDWLRSEAKNIVED